jgi:hypothetical protein
MTALLLAWKYRQIGSILRSNLAQTGVSDVILILNMQYLELQVQVFLKQPDLYPEYGNSEFIGNPLYTSK